MSLITLCLSLSLLCFSFSVAVDDNVASPVTFSRKLLAPKSSAAPSPSELTGASSPSKKTGSGSGSASSPSELASASPWKMTAGSASSPSELGSSGSRVIPGMPPTKLSPSERIPGIPPVLVPASSDKSSSPPNPEQGPSQGPTPPEGDSPPSEGGKAPKSSKPVDPAEPDMAPTPSGEAVTAATPGVVYVFSVIFVVLSSTWPLVTVF